MPLASRVGSGRITSIVGMIGSEFSILVQAGILPGCIKSLAPCLQRPASFVNADGNIVRFRESAAIDPRKLIPDFESRILNGADHSVICTGSTKADHVPTR